MIWELAAVGRNLFSSILGPNEQGMKNEGQLSGGVCMGTGILGILTQELGKPTEVREGGFHAPAQGLGKQQ